MAITHVPRNMAATNTTLVVTMIMRSASKTLWVGGREGGEGEKEEGREGGGRERRKKGARAILH